MTGKDIRDEINHQINAIQNRSGELTEKEKLLFEYGVHFGTNLSLKHLTEFDSYELVNEYDKSLKKKSN